MAPARALIPFHGLLILNPRLAELPPEDQSKQFRASELSYITYLTTAQPADTSLANMQKLLSDDHLQ